MNRRDHILIAEVAIAALVILAVLGTVVDTSPHAWVSAVWIVAIITFGLTALFLSVAAIGAGWVVAVHWTRRLMRHTVRRDQMPLQRSGGNPRRRRGPTARVTAPTSDPFQVWAAQLAEATSAEAATVPAS